MCSGLVMAWRLATWPTSRSPSFVNATTDGVMRLPSSLAMTLGSRPSMIATTLLVVPRSIPMIFATCNPPGNLSNSGNFCAGAAGFTASKLTRGAGVSNAEAAERSTPGPCRASRARAGVCAQRRLRDLVRGQRGAPGGDVSESASPIRPSSSKVRIPRMITESGTTGFGWCTWYSGIVLRCSRRALPAARRRTIGGNGAIGKILLATTTDSRLLPSALARMRSLFPAPYHSAVSNSVTPSSSARCTMSIAVPAAYSSPYPHSRVPNCHVPRPIRLT